MGRGRVVKEMGCFVLSYRCYEDVNYVITVKFFRLTVCVTICALLCVLLCSSVLFSRQNSHDWPNQTLQLP
jgi:hypothetical protein